jgi:hypothetical protein
MRRLLTVLLVLATLALCVFLLWVMLRIDLR